MDPSPHRRRWLGLAAAALVVALVVAVVVWLASDDEPEPAAEAVVYRAVSTLETAPGVEPRLVEGWFQYLARGTVPEAVATSLDVDWELDAAACDSERSFGLRIDGTAVCATAIPSQGVIRISASDPTPRRATELTRALGRELVAAVAGEAQRAYDAEVARLTALGDELEQRVTTLTTRLDDAPEGSDEHAALIEQLTGAQITRDEVAAELAALVAAGPPEPPLEISARAAVGLVEDAQLP